MINQLCMTCRQKDNRLILNKLRDIEVYINRCVKDYKSLADINLENSFLSEIKHIERCKNGLGKCKYLSKQYSTCRLIVNNICKKLPILIEDDDRDNINMVLNLCRGYFPRTYRFIEESLIQR